MATTYVDRDAFVKLRPLQPAQLISTNKVKGTSPPVSTNCGDRIRRSARSVMRPKRFTHDLEDIPKKKKKKSKQNDDGKNQVKEQKGHVVNKEDSENAYGGLSAYELERLENIRQNQIFLSSIRLFKATEELKESLRCKPTQRRLTSSKGAATEVLPPRKSLRLLKKKAEPLPLEPRRPKKPSGPLPMKPVNMEDSGSLHTKLLELCSEDFPKEEKVELDLKEYRCGLKSMTIRKDRVAMMKHGSVHSAAFHPCTSSLLMAAGDNFGHVGIWNLEGCLGEDGVVLFEPHTRPVGCLAFSRAQPNHLLSLSCDGSVRCMDIEKAVFNDVYNIEESLKMFDFLTDDCSTLVVGALHGDVAIVDRRTPGNSHEWVHSVGPGNMVRCVSVHPLHRQYFVVAESWAVRVYDSRCLKRGAVCELPGHSLYSCSAYFSPRTGNRVLTTCADNCLRIYDTSAITNDASLMTSIRNISDSYQRSATWDPKQEDCFAVGSMEMPRQVKVFHETGQLQHSFMDDDHLTSILPIVTFHPSRNALLGGNCTGRLHVFTD